MPDNEHSKPHTPGPWTFSKEGGQWHIRDAAGNSMMCDEQYYPWVPDNEADWNLIASAPELLAALAGVEWSGGDQYGNSICPQCGNYRSKRGHEPGCILDGALKKAQAEGKVLPDAQ